MKNYIFLALLALFLTVAGCLPNVGSKGLKTAENKPIEAEVTERPATEPIPVAPAVTPKSEPAPVPAVSSNEMSWPVPFAPQAPYGVWDELHEETCEEASMTMVAYYFDKKSLSFHLMEQELLGLTKWQADHGYQVDLSAVEMKTVLKEYYGLESQLIFNVSVDSIKTELDQGNLVILPVAGRALGNPYFQNPGPIYHALVVRGYDESAKQFITNDPGTKRGEAYRYNYQVLINAIHDWNHNLEADGMTDEEIASGQKIFISIPPQ